VVLFYNSVKQTKQNKLLHSIAVDGFVHTRANWPLRNIELLKSKRLITLLASLVFFKAFCSLGESFSHVVVYGPSMAPSLQPGTHLLVYRLNYVDCDSSFIRLLSIFNFNKICRGDLVLIKNLGKRRTVTAIKRVIGLPGESVRISNNTVYINNSFNNTVFRVYVGGLRVGDSLWTLREAEYYVLGDNHPRSLDSRHFGPINAENLVGKACLPIWPPKRSILNKFVGL